MLVHIVLHFMQGYLLTEFIYYYYLLSKVLYLCVLVNVKYNMHIPHLH
jgi:hypothetical protein